jgi:hypothetical protein
VLAHGPHQQPVTSGQVSGSGQHRLV